MRRIPRDTSYFRDIIETGKIYVDKTPWLLELIRPDSDKFYFFSRPRRFGKSLMIATLDEIFRGNRQYFKGLAIDSSDYDWKPYPVIRLDMSGVTARAATLDVMHERLMNRLRSCAEEYGVEIETKHAPEAFVQLIGKLAAQNDEGKCVLLIDEYDAPITGLLDDLPYLEQTRRYLNEFYAVIKENNRFLRFTILTGVSKFTKLSIFSGLNSPLDISMDLRFAALVGFTEQELRANFAEHIHAFAEKRGVTDEEIMRLLKKWYDGYHFAKGQKEGVYNPFSIAYALMNLDFENYWGTSGGATIIYERLRRLQRMPEDLNHTTAVRSEFEACDAENLTLNALLYQGGYLTIAGYNEKTKSYRLRIPNDEIRETLDEGYVRECLEFSPGFTMSSLFEIAMDALDAGDTTTIFDEVVHTLFANIPCDWRLKGEAEAKRYFVMFFKLLGADIAGEVPSARGKADVVMKTEAAIYVMEFKFDESPDAALRQIDGKGYAEPFRADGLPVIKVGVNYSSETRNIAWKAVK